MGNQTFSKKKETLPIDTMFNLPANIPVWPQGDGFANGIIDLGGLKVSQISTFNKVWTTLQGGSDNAGATFFEPKGIPEGFFMLGCYSQPNNKSLFGRILVAKDDSSVENEALKKPLDYTLIWTSKSQNIKQDNDGYVWLPTPPNGYKALGHVVTITPEKPSLDKIRCVRSDFTDQCETSSWIWGPGKSTDDKGFNVFDIRPSNRGIQAPGVLVGTFFAQDGGTTTSSIPIACLKNTNLNFSSMPNINQIEALVKAYSPIMYLHPNEKYQSSSVNWYFTNGALLYKKGEESNPVPIDPTGSNLPQGGNNDGAYWLDLPIDKANKERVKKGDFKSTQVYIHVKPMFGGTFTDLAMWVFYPFNGPAIAKFGLIDIPLGKIGEHVGDWEHVTLRISNFDGGLKKVYFSQHSSGQWVEASELEFQSGNNNKPATYSSLNGHAMYPKAGLVLQGVSEIGIRNDAAKSNMVVDFGVGFEIVSGDYLGSEIIEPPWLNYLRQWGPNISYDLAEELNKLEKVFPVVKKIESSLPNELLGEEGPTGPKVKRNWSGDES
ncbi:hypothetical protein TanjilG_12220 [Lupinus angustifolius]|uniref:Vacuolar protein sorting-associated protein 62 n=1 Tax=Lupinus angustifolius TaxID=3871 RepID=A0A1J7IC19_LUPAN|nr:PREDICTED: uncharacterized protein LOC109347981 [Lupinus angustifolius]OIW11701.1 hypothetical protein TanjilG_12220 [Lupinus angustifolius]